MGGPLHQAAAHQPDRGLGCAARHRARLDHAGGERSGLRVGIDFHVVEIEVHPRQRIEALVDPFLGAEDDHGPEPEREIGKACQSVALGLGADHRRYPVLERPGALDMINRAKFDAWAKRKGTSRDDAMRAYVDLVAKLKSAE